MSNRKPGLLLSLLLVAATPAGARPSLVCQVTASVPYSTALHHAADDTRIFTQTAGLIEERRSAAPTIRQWAVVIDTPDQLMAVDTGRSMTLLINRPDNTFSESGVEVQRRGYCRLNELP